MTVERLLPSAKTRRRFVLAGLGFWLAIQIVVPLRHHLYPGDTGWTEQGHRFAWRMKLRDKVSRATFTVHDPATGRIWLIDNRRFLTPRQNGKMASRPDMILQFAHHLADTWRRREQVAAPQVRALVLSSLNGREPALLIDSTRDLAKVPRDLHAADWILPLPTPLPAR